MYSNLIHVSVLYTKETVSVCTSRVALETVLHRDLYLCRASWTKRHRLFSNDREAGKIALVFSPD